MGCDIHVFVEEKRKDKWIAVPDFKPFDWRQYGMFSFFAGVRNYHGVPPFGECRGYPEDMTEESKEFFGNGYHSATHFYYKELLDFKYETIIEDRRYTGVDSNGHMNGGLTREPGNGIKKTYEDFLGEEYLSSLNDIVHRWWDHLPHIQDIRIIMAFDS